MGRMEDALKKAAEERERKRAEEAGRPTFRSEPAAAEPASAAARAVDVAEPAGPRTAARAAVGSPALARQAQRFDERLVVAREPHGRHAEQFRKIRANLTSVRPMPRTLLVTSGAPGEGKSLFAANLALALLETRQGDVLLVDANLRHPELPGLVAGRPGPGLSEALTGAEPDVAALIQQTEAPGLWFLAAGSVGDAAAQVLAPEILKRALDRLPSKFRHIVVDSPCAVDYADVSLMAPDVDGVIVVVKVEGGRRAASRKAVEILEGSGARVLGSAVWAGV
jgi:Mrp family chromosome partitioning ATPase